MLRAETGTQPHRTRRLVPHGKPEAVDRSLAVEVPVAIEFNGIGYAVMMATPIDLHDFAVGFTLSERLVMHREEIVDIEAIAQSDGWLLRITIIAGRLDAVIARARQRVSESSCGLCGLDSLAEVMRPLPVITATPSASGDALFLALATLRDHQPLNNATGAVHVAAFCSNDGTIVMTREDVGRHNALDKLIGALATAVIAPASGFFLLSARCSYELVEKAIIAGCPLLVTISAPTTLAAERAASHRLTLVALARSDAMLVVSDPHSLYR